MYYIEKIMTKINHEETTYVELIVLHDNVVKSTEVHRELIIEAIVNRMRIDFPTEAKKKFSAKDALAREILEKVYEKLEGDFDLSGNTLKAGVKTGGGRINGTKYVNVYISYKNTERDGVALSIDQLTVDDELEFIVSKYCTKKNHKDTNLHPFGVNELNKAVELYQKILCKLIK